jgi:hypothetical protein
MSSIYGFTTQFNCSTTPNSTSTKNHFPFSGYRRIFLEDYSGRKLSPASLLIKIKITEEE